MKGNNTLNDKRVYKFVAVAVLIVVCAVAGTAIYRARVYAANVANPLCYSKTTGFMESDLNGEWSEVMEHSQQKSVVIFEINNRLGTLTQQIQWAPNTKRRSSVFKLKAVVKPGKKDFVIWFYGERNRSQGSIMKVIDKNRLYWGATGHYLIKID